MLDQVYRRAISAAKRLFKIHQRYSKGKQSYQPTIAQSNDLLVFLNNTPALLPKVDLYERVRGTNKIRDGM